MEIGSGKSGIFASSEPISILSFFLGIESRASRIPDNLHSSHRTVEYFFLPRLKLWPLGLLVFNCELDTVHPGDPH